MGGILCVFAHPDDEQFGTAGALLRCVERGIPVHLLCATSGEAGEISDPALATRDSLAEVREEELRTACALLGLQSPRLLRYPDGGLASVDSADLRDRIVETMLDTRPRVVITFDANGGYGHPDHIAIHHATLVAVDAAAESGHIIDKLYATAYPRAMMELMNEGLRGLGEPELDFGDVRTIDLHEIGTSEARITTAAPVEKYFERVMASLFAHRSQYGAQGMFARFPEELNRRMFGTNFFVRLRPAPQPGSPLPDENDLWQGLG
jgi:LmbE family N-acetylglucosaminyl deacetylase